LMARIFMAYLVLFWFSDMFNYTEFIHA